MDETGLNGVQEQEMPERMEAPVRVEDRREHSRYPFDATVTAEVTDGSMMFMGEVRDISLAGCYVETRARLRLKPGTRVSLIFRVSAGVFRPMATVRSLRQGQGAGFRFEPGDMATRQKLDELLRALALESMPV